MVLWFLAGSRAPETAETPYPPPRASARHQPTPLPAEGLEERAGFTSLRSLKLLHPVGLGASGRPGRGRFPVTLSIHPFDWCSRKS